MDDSRMVTTRNDSACLRLGALCLLCFSIFDCGAGAVYRHRDVEAAATGSSREWLRAQGSCRPCEYDSVYTLATEQKLMSTR